VLPGPRRQAQERRLEATSLLRFANFSWDEVCCIGR
jgi:hypothetical protein